MAHVLPFQRSARVTTTPEPLVKSPTAMQEDELEQETPVSWPVRPGRFRVGTIDHPDPLAAAGGTFACAAAPTVGPSSTTAAPAATAARHIRPRIATPPLPGKSCLLARVTADKPGQQHPAPGERCAETENDPPLCGKAWYGGQISVNIRTCKFDLVLPGFCLGDPGRTGAAACCPPAPAAMPGPLASAWCLPRSVIRSDCSSPFFLIGADPW
jgi:hypothetical protein